MIVPKTVEVLNFIKFIASPQELRVSSMHPGVFVSVPGQIGNIILLTSVTPASAFTYYYKYSIYSTVLFRSFRKITLIVFLKIHCAKNDNVSVLF